MGRYQLLVPLFLFILASLPAHAYADPSGGTLFQILMPMLGGIWAMWMIFANRIRKGVAALFRKLRGAEEPQTTE
jgi:hypothetical protein